MNASMIKPMKPQTAWAIVDNHGRWYLTELTRGAAIQAWCGEYTDWSDYKKDGFTVRKVIIKEQHDS